VRTEHKTKNLTAQGAYVLADAEGKRQAILMATGSEVAIAMAARDLLQAEGIGTRVVSMPCWELFEEQDEAYRRRSCRPARCAWRSRPRSASAGTAGSTASAGAGEIGLRRHARLRRLGPGGCALREVRDHAEAVVAKVKASRPGKPKPQCAAFFPVTAAMSGPPRGWPRG
jgi:hypothetical protein